MKFKSAIFLLILFFVIVNTSAIWDVYLGGWDILVFLILLLTYLILALVLIFQFIRLIIERFKNRQRIIFSLILTLVLSIILIAPNGIISFENDSGVILKAEQEGAANCHTTFKLYNDNSFS